ncbi:MAG: hypothetical protein IH914_05320 [candidate division Zixibacteria bacterium]|nr:hypothetical protein [candidate division Zixibacteria bacterium]
MLVVTYNYYFFRYVVEDYGFGPGLTGLIDDDHVAPSIPGIILEDSREGIHDHVGQEVAPRGGKPLGAKAGRGREQEFFGLQQRIGNQGDLVDILLELLQARGGGSPAYEVVDEEGPDHRKVFQVAIRYHGERLGLGHGLTKKEAEQLAARQALEVLSSRSPSDAPDDEN